MVDALARARPALRDDPRGAAPARGDARVRASSTRCHGGARRAARPREFARGVRRASSAAACRGSSTGSARNEESRGARPCARCWACRARALRRRGARARARPRRRTALLGETLNVTTLVKLTRALLHAHYTFKKKLSHTADSQDQRHRMTPASRPVPAAPTSRDEPDYVDARRSSRATTRRARAPTTRRMARTWEAIAPPARAAASPTRTASYLLPNAVAIRFTESRRPAQPPPQAARCASATTRRRRSGARRRDEAHADRRGEPRASAATSCRPAPCATSPRCARSARRRALLRRRVWTMDQSEYTRAL